MCYEATFGSSKKQSNVFHIYLLYYYTNLCCVTWEKTIKFLSIASFSVLRLGRFQVIDNEANLSQIMLQKKNQQ